VSLWELLRLTDDEGMSLSPGTFKEFEVCSSVRKIYTFYEKKYSIFDDDWSPFFFFTIYTIASDKTRTSVVHPIPLSRNRTMTM
jgi:hypothetical protein